MERGLVLFGIVAVIVGIGTGYLMYAHPEGLNPAWPLGLAMLAPAAFLLSGLHMIAAGLGYPSVANMALLAIAVCLLAIVNWAAFFTPHIKCSQMVSFLGVAVFSRHPSEAECRVGLRVIISCIDALILLPILWFAWRKRQGRSVAPTE